MATPTAPIAPTASSGKSSFASIFTPISNFVSTGLGFVSTIITSNNAVDIEQAKLDSLDKQLEIVKTQGNNQVKVKALELQIQEQKTQLGLAKSQANSKTFFYLIIFGFLGFVSYLILRPKTPTVVPQPVPRRDITV